MKKLFLLAVAAFMLTTTHAENTDTLTVRIQGMRCSECGHKVKNILRKDKGVGTMEFNYERRTVKIAYDPQKTTVENIYASLAASGRYAAKPYSPTEVIRRDMGQRIDDMHCQKCVDRIAQVLNKMEGIDSIAPHLDKHYYFIRYDANRTSRDEIRAALNKAGYTPCNYYSSPKIAWYYLTLPADQCTEETQETVLAINGVEDVNVNPKRRSMAITYFNDEIQGDKLLEQIQQAGIKAVLPKPHECDEEKEKAKK